MTVTSRRGLIREVAELVQSLQEPDTDVDTVLSELTESAVTAVPGAQYAGITVASREGKVRDRVVDEPLSDIARRHPAAHTRGAVPVRGLGTADDPDRRHAPERPVAGISRDAIEQTPIRSIVSFRLFVERKTMGALNFYADDRMHSTRTRSSCGLIWATHTALAWNLVRRERAIPKRAGIPRHHRSGQGHGHGAFQDRAVQAFELLKRLSQDSNTPVAAVARKLVESGTPELMIASRTGRVESTPLPGRGRAAARRRAAVARSELASGLPANA